MKIEFEGRTWQLDTTDVSMQQAETITDFTGLTLAGWEKAAWDHENPVWLKSIRCMYWLMLEQNDSPAPLMSLNFAVLKFYMAVAEGNATEASAAQAAETDPTRPGAGNAAEAQPAPSTPAG